MAKIFGCLSQQAEAAIEAARAALSPGRGRRGMNVEAILVAGFGLLCATMPLEIGQLTFALVGALTYAAVQTMRKSTKSPFQRKGSSLGKKVLEEADEARQESGPREARARIWDAPRPQRSRPSQPQRDAKMAVGKEEQWQPSVQQVVAPAFKAGYFSAQVDELLGQIVPSPQGEQLMQKLAAAAKASLKNFLPEAEVMAFASANIMRGTAFGVAIPEVDIIVNATPALLAERLQQRIARPIPHAERLDARKLQKSALRACTDELVTSGVFKFRRSAFKGLEPKVTLLATVFSGSSIPVDVSINTVTPLYNAALLSECGQIDSRARDLILLVRRWAKDRGVSHAAKGHLSPYAWSLVAIYFLQVWKDAGKPIISALQAFKGSSGGMAPQRQGSPPRRRPAERSTTCVATIFQEFVRFYLESFDWRNEAISVRAGVRRPPAAKLPLHIVELADGTTELAPCVEDPFEPARNLGSIMTGVSLGRLKEELARADELCSRGASLSELLEPWAPPVRGSTPGARCGTESSDEV